MYYRTWQIFLILSAWIFNSICAVHLLNATSGIYTGNTVNYRNITVHQYLGIEYGRITKRFERAEPIVQQNDNIINATSFGPVCKQIANICKTNNTVSPSITTCSINYGIFAVKSLSTEQCLYLNVYIPVTDNKTTKAILMWIHGGSGQIGTGNIFDGTVLAALGDIIVITFNFRLNLFGFLSSGDERLEGNLGLYDQSMVLDWIYENGQALGGDIQRITVGGHSAGSPNAYYLALSPLNRGRIRRLLLQSGCPFNVWSHIQANEAIEKFNLVAYENKCGSLITFDEKLKCLREKDFDFIGEYGRDSYTSANHTNVVVAGDYMNRFREDINYNDTLANIDILVGSNDDEGIYVALGPMAVGAENQKSESLNHANYTDISLKFLAAMQPNNTCLHEKALEFYHINNIPVNCSQSSDCYCSLFYNYSRLISDVLFNNDYYRFIQQLTKHSNKTFIYQYSYRTSVNHGTICKHYIYKHNLVGHFAELEYTWGTPLLFEKTDFSDNLISLIKYSTYERNAIHNYTDEQIEFSKELIEQWSNFIKYGQPSSRKFENQWKPIINLSDGFSMNLKLNESEIKQLIIPSSVQFWMDGCPTVENDNTTVQINNDALIYEIALTLVVCTSVFFVTYPVSYLFDEFILGNE